MTRSERWATKIRVILPNHYVALTNGWNFLASADEAEREDRRKRICVGVEQIKKVEAHYCDLCRMFLPRGTENEYPEILAG